MIVTNEQPQNNKEQSKPSKFTKRRIWEKMAKVLWFIKTIEKPPLDQTRNYLFPKKLTIVPNYMLENDDLFFIIWNQQIWIRKIGDQIEIHDIQTWKIYKCEKEKEYIIWREWDIEIDKTDKEASRKHLTLKMTSDWDILLKDISKNRTKYYFVGKDDYIYNPLEKKSDDEVQIVPEDEVQIVPEGEEQQIVR